MGLLAGWAVAVPIGAIGSYLVALGIRVRFSVAAACALGVASADAIYAGLAALGGPVIADALSAVQRPLRLLGAVTLAALALRAARQAVQETRRGVGLTTPPAGGPSGRLAGYLRLAFLTLANPATIACFSSLLIADPSLSSLSAGAAALFVAGVLVASGTWQLFLVAAGSVLGRAFAGRRACIATQLTSAAVMGGFAVTLAI